VKNCIPKIGIAIEIASIFVSVAKLIVLPVWVQFLLPVCTRWCSPSSDGVDTSGRGSGVSENCVVAAEITLKCLHVT